MKDDARSLIDDDDVVKHVHSTSAAEQGPVSLLDKFTSYHSDWKRLGRAVGWMIMVVKYLQKRVAERHAVNKDR